MLSELRCCARTSEPRQRGWEQVYFSEASLGITGYLYTQIVVGNAVAASVDIVAEHVRQDYSCQRTSQLSQHCASDSKLGDTAIKSRQNMQSLR